MHFVWYIFSTLTSHTFTASSFSSIYAIFNIYNNSYFRSFVIFFSSTILSQYPSAHTHTCMYTYTIMRSWTRSLLLNSWTLNTVITHMSVLYSVFCILLMLFLEFSFWLLFVMLVYIFPLVLLLFFWTMWEFQSQMFFCLSLYTYCIHYINMEEMCPYSGSLCMLRSHANVTPFICLISMNSQCFGVPNFHN